MSANFKISGPVSSDKRLSRRLKLTGIIVLLLGVGGAGTIYFLGTRSVDLSDDLSMVSYGRAQARQMEILYGKSGGLIEDWSNDLKQPNTQAFVIASVSVIIASGCFYFARLAGNEDKIR
jgi:hypothetical protein